MARRLRPRRVSRQVPGTVEARCGWRGRVPAAESPLGRMELLTSAACSAQCGRDRCQVVAVQWGRRRPGEPVERCAEALAPRLPGSAPSLPRERLERLVLLETERRQAHRLGRMAKSIPLGHRRDGVAEHVLDGPRVHRDAIERRFVAVGGGRMGARRESRRGLRGAGGDRHERGHRALGRFRGQSGRRQVARGRARGRRPRVRLPVVLAGGGVVLRGCRRR